MTAALLAVLTLAGVSEVTLKDFAPNAPDSDICRQQVRTPFGPGEVARYQVRLGRVSVGRATIEVAGEEDVRGHSTWRARMSIRGGIPFARVNTFMDSWFDPCTMTSRRFHRDQHEVRFKRVQTFEIDPEAGTYTHRQTGDEQPLSTAEPLDQVSFLYYLRTVPLAPGDTVVLDRYFQEHGNPVTVEVLRRETITVPAGMYQAIVLRPTFQTGGLFSEGGEAEVYLSDDDRRIPLMVTSRVPAIGRLSLRLDGFEGASR